MLSKDHGFTLIEALVAVVILALFATSVQMLFARGLRGISAAETHAHALAVGRSVLATIGNERPLKTGETLAGEVDGFRWEADIARYGTAGPVALQPPSVVGYWITLDVRWTDTLTGKPQSLELQKLRFAPPERDNE